MQGESLSASSTSTLPCKYQCLILIQLSLAELRIIWYYSSCTNCSFLLETVPTFRDIEFTMAASIVSVPGGTPQNPASNTITIAPNASNAAKIKRRSNATNIVIENSAAGPQDSSPISAIWREVLKEHVANFSYEDQKHCTAISCHVAMDKRSLEAMLSTVRPRYDAGAFNRFLDKVGLISQHILSFGRAIDVSVGGGDLTTGVIWGGVRILLEVTSPKYGKAHCSVCSCLDSLTLRVNRYQHAQPLCMASLSISYKTCLAISLYLKDG